MEKKQNPSANEYYTQLCGCVLIGVSRWNQVVGFILGARLRAVSDGGMWTSGSCAAIDEKSRHTTV